jgi:hypothetical protein
MDFLRRNVVDETAYHVLPRNEDVELSSSPIGVSSAQGQASGSSNSNGESQDGINIVIKEGSPPSQPSFVKMLPTWAWEPLTYVAPSGLPVWMQRFEQLPSSGNSTNSPRKLHPTAWLDGVRGVASLCVLFHHSSVLWYLELNNGWGCNPESRWLIQ